MTCTSADATETGLVMNPNSGNADHGQIFRDRAPTEGLVGPGYQPSSPEGADGG